MDETEQQNPYKAHCSEDGTRKQTVKEHLMGTADRAEAFAKAFGGQEQARLAGLLHDIGKYSQEFQRRLQDGPRVDHATAGAKEAIALRQAEVAFAVAGHHGGLPDGGGKNDAMDAGTLLGRIRKPLPDYKAWREEVQLPAAARPAWLSRDNFSNAFYIRMLYSCLVDADYLDTEAFMDGQTPRGGYETISVLLERLNQYVKPWWNAKNELNHKRCEILRQCFTVGETSPQGLYTLAVPTGGGKTVSSLAFALAHGAARKKNRVIYVIPYTSIIDQTAQVFQEILGEENVLEHHSGIDYSMPEGEVDPALYRKALSTENWDAPVIVTTAVQFFESLYANRSSRCRKLHNIADSVVIFDEAQTLPMDHLRPCVAAIGQLVQHYGVTAVLCTATQPALGPLFDQLAPGLQMREICPGTEELYQFFRRTTLRHAGELNEETLAAELNAVPQALCVVNRRKTAQQLYEMLEPEGRYCLTTLLCPADRKRLLGQIRKRLKDGLPCRVVSTSLIEAGVDVDFPAAWREEAGLDSILQTAGRCNREGRHPTDESLVTVFRLEGQKPPQMIRQNVDSTGNVLRRFGDPSMPQAIEAYFQFLRAIKGDAALDKIDVLDAFARGIGGCGMPFAKVADSFHLIENAAVTVYIPVDEGEELVRRLQAGQGGRTLYRQLGQYAVNIYPEHLENLLAAGAVEPVDENGYVLTDMNLYDRNTGLQLDVETGKGICI